MTPARLAAATLGSAVLIAVAARPRAAASWSLRAVSIATGRAGMALRAVSISAGLAHLSLSAGEFAESAPDGAASE